jgi:uncharacterized protein YdhG (YjbR/CyaY superfamily)
LEWQSLQWQRGRDRYPMKSRANNSIDEYISQFPSGVQEILRKVRTTIKSAAPDAVEAMKYQIPTFVMQGNLVHFAAFKDHIGFYPTPSAIQKFRDELAAYKSAKGSIQFPLTKPIPYSLIRKIVEFRVKETQAKIAAGKKARPSRKVP